jgi:hypothetical protein
VATFFQTLVEFSAIELECSMPKLASDRTYLFAGVFTIAIIVLPYFGCSQDFGSIPVAICDQWRGYQFATALLSGLLCVLFIFAFLLRGQHQQLAASKERERSILQQQLAASKERERSILQQLEDLRKSDATDGKQIDRGLLELDLRSYLSCFEAYGQLSTELVIEAMNEIPEGLKERCRELDEHVYRGLAAAKAECERRNVNLLGLENLAEHSVSSMSSLLSESGDTKSPALEQGIKDVNGKTGNTLPAKLTGTTGRFSELQSMRTLGSQLTTKVLDVTLPAELNAPDEVRIIMKIARNLIQWKACNNKLEGAVLERNKRDCAATPLKDSPQRWFITEQKVQSILEIALRFLCATLGMTVHDATSSPKIFLQDSVLASGKILGGFTDLIICKDGKIVCIVELKVFFDHGKYLTQLLSTLQGVSAGINGDEKWSANVLDEDKSIFCHGMLFNGTQLIAAKPTGSKSFMVSHIVKGNDAADLVYSVLYRSQDHSLAEVEEYKYSEVKIEKESIDEGNEDGNSDHDVDGSAGSSGGDSWGGQDDEDIKKPPSSPARGRSSKTGGGGKINSRQCASLAVNIMGNKENQLGNKKNQLGNKETHLGNKENQLGHTPSPLDLMFQELESNRGDLRAALTGYRSVPANPYLR